jgi:NADH-quinone oxidoreductase subunit J
VVALFYILALVTVVSAIMVITRPNAVHSALWLVLTFFAVAGLFILQGAEFIAAVQVLVYAGGIMVLFLFVIMLVNIETVVGFVAPRGRLVTAVALAALTVIVVGIVVASAETPGTVSLPQGGLGPASPGETLVEGVELGNLEAVGMKLLTSYLLSFELVSVVLLVAIIGAIVLCRKEL